MYCEFITGPAGTGKTFQVMRRAEEDPKWGVISSTTGISAVNLGTITLNSLLKYFDTDSLTDSYFRGFLNKRLHDLSNEYENLVIDEVSMMAAEQLDVIHRAVNEVNQYRTARGQMGIILTGDFCQLPPVKARWAFEAACWLEFAANTTKLTKFWRQEDTRFLEALQLLRSGDGPGAVEILKGLLNWEKALNQNFDGTTIVSKNAAVDRYNWIRYRKLTGPEFIAQSKRWGKQRGEWKHIPEELRLKEGALVMVLSNAVDFRYVNGDCGHVLTFDEDHQVFVVKLERNDLVVEIPEITRGVESKEEPEEGQEIWDGVSEHTDQPYFDPLKRRWVYGQVTYYPLRLAYSATVHKTQGLSLDKIQIDVRDAFFGSPSMAYVAVSRARTPQGVTIVGTPEQFGRRVKAPEEVKPWI